MPDITTLALFIPTFFLVSVTPGLCMMLALSLGMTIGFRRTLPMMLGELLGVAIVALAAAFGVAALLLNTPQLFTALKWLGGGYLIYLGIEGMRSSGKLASDAEIAAINRKNLFGRGFVTAIANPKGWAFMVSLLPPFLDHSKALAPQMGALLAIILASEFICMSLYASGGSSLRRMLNQQNVKRVNRLSGLVMIGLGVWLWLG
ncbi:LysE family translocator [Ferrimonas senticii]|uniref:LysE family translocator n=1 Tax=Ferrimonas senticii TaxID=394566 RepID=UPI0003FBADF7|nr:LysE family translocator [Ferrimonas senticii]